MFMAIRLIIGGLCWGVAAYSIARHCLKNKHIKLIIASAFTVICVAIFSFIPIENFVYTFPSPETAFRYYTGIQNVDIIVEGTQSCLVVGARNNSHTLLIIPKGEDGWKIGLGTDTKLISNRIIDDSIILIYQHGSSTDQYLSITNLNEESITLSDAYDSSFVPLIQNEVQPDRSHATYFANIPNADKPYWICVNGKIITLTD